jgi:hypothetical protein
MVVKLSLPVPMILSLKLPLSACENIKWNMITIQEMILKVPAIFFFFNEGRFFLLISSAQSKDVHIQNYPLGYDVI